MEGNFYRYFNFLHDSKAFSFILIIGVTFFILFCSHSSLLGCLVASNKKIIVIFLLLSGSTTSSIVFFVLDSKGIQLFISFNFLSGFHSFVLMFFIYFNKNTLMDLRVTLKNKQWQENKITKVSFTIM